MGKRGKRSSSTNESQSSGSNSSLTNTPSNKSGQKKLKIAADSSVKTKLTQFAFETRTEKAAQEDKMATEADDVFVTDNDSSTSADRSMTKGITNEDLMRELRSNRNEISKLQNVIEELRSSLLATQIDNDNLKTEVAAARKREEDLKSKLAEVKFTAELADRRSEELGTYIRRNNIRIFGVPETSGGRNEEAAGACEDKMLKLFRDRLKTKVEPGDIEAVHRLGQPRKKPTPSGSSGQSGDKSPPRGIIVRFVSRKVRDAVLYSRKLLRGTGITIVEDLTPRAYSLLCKVKSEPGVCKQAWTKNGRVVVKMPNDRIVQVDSMSDLEKYRQSHSQQGPSERESSVGKQ